MIPASEPNALSGSIWVTRNSRVKRIPFGMRPWNGGSTPWSQRRPDPWLHGQGFRPCMNTAWEAAHPGRILADATPILAKRQKRGLGAARAPPGKSSSESVQSDDPNGSVPSPWIPPAQTSLLGTTGRDVFHRRWSPTPGSNPRRGRDRATWRSKPPLARPPNAARASSSAARGILH